MHEPTGGNMPDLTKEAFAWEVDIPVRMISRYEAEKYTNITGETLKKIIERGPVNVDEAIEITISIAKGLEKAHEKGIVHRDIKPV